MILAIRILLIILIIVFAWGAICEKETQEHLEELDAFFVEHITDMEEILHQFCTEGIKPGKYTCLDNVHLWKYEGEKQK